MSSILAILVLGLNVQGDPVQELTDIVAKTQKVQSYGFEVLTTSEGGFGRRGGDAAPPAPLTGSWQKGKPVRLASGDSLAFRDGQRAVYRDAEGGWKPLDRRAMMRGGRGGGGGAERGADGQAPPPDPERLAMAGRMELLRAPLPHTLLADLGGGVEEVTREDGEGIRTYRGKLTKDAASKLSGTNFGGRGGGGFQGPELEHSGSFSVVVTDKGVVQEFEIQTHSSGSFREREIEMSRKSSVKVSGVNATEVEVPEAVTVALAASVEEATDEIF
ncbi:MAG: hypothetical protein ISR76_11335 [Planctomycetes bacterium]|nr:hypothetical protein [Planctomycetota bacterium]